MLPDYTDLIKKLRNRRVCIQATGGLDDYDLFRKAADAIEELQAQLTAARQVLQWLAESSKEET